MHHYTYSVPLPSKGGTDALSVFRGLVLISASAPGTTGAAAPQPSYPAVYQVTFHPGHLIARIRPVFYDEARATVANSATCPGPGFPANYLGSLNPWTGHISRVPVSGTVLLPQGMLFVPAMRQAVAAGRPLWSRAGIQRPV